MDKFVRVIRAYNFFRIFVLSAEGTTKGDPLTMPIYVLGSILLLREASRAGATQSWYADDAIAAGSLRRMHAWWSILGRKVAIVDITSMPQNLFCL